MGALSQRRAWIFLLLGLVPTAFAADISGKWSGTLAIVNADLMPGEPSSIQATLKQSGATLTGTWGPDADRQWPIQNGKIDDNKMIAEVTAPDGAFYVIVASVDGDRITGSVSLTSAGQRHKAVLDLKRAQ